MNKPLQKYLRTLTLVFHVDSKKPQNYICDEKFTSHPIKDHPYSTCADRKTGGGSHDESVRLRTGKGWGFKPGE